MKKMKSVLISSAAIGILCAGLVGCGGSNTSKIRIGFINPDTGGGETVAWASYVSDYLSKAYSDKYQFYVSTFSAFSSTTSSTTECKDMLAKGCKAIVEIGYGTEANFTACQEKGAYYCAVGSSPNNKTKLTSAEWGSINDHFVGVLGPSLDQEAQAGYDMADHYIKQGLKDFGIYGCVIGYAQSYGVTVHAWRVAGMLKRMLEDAPDSTTQYCSFADANGKQVGFTKKSAVDEMEAAIAGRSNFYGVDAKGKQWAVGDIVNVGPYRINYWQQNVADTTLNDAEIQYFTTDKAGNNNPVEGYKSQVILGSASAYAMFAKKGRCVIGSDGKIDLGIAEVESFAAANQAAMESGYITYECGKMNSCIGPAFAAVFSALNGRNFGIDAAGKAELMVGSQGFWNVGNVDEFKELATFDAYSSHPAYSRALLETMTYKTEAVTAADGKTYPVNNITKDEFLAKFNAYQYESVKAARNAAEA